MEFLSYSSKDLYSDLIIPCTGILALFLKTLEFLSYPFTANIVILALSFQTMEFCPDIYTHWFSDRILQNSGILALFLYTLAFLPNPSKLCSSSPVFIHIEIFILFFQTLEFWPYFLDIGIWISSFQTFDLRILTLTFRTWNSGPSFINIGILI